MIDLVLDTNQVVAGALLTGRVVVRGEPARAVAGTVELLCRVTGAGSREDGAEVARVAVRLEVPPGAGERGAAWALRVPFEPVSLEGSLLAIRWVVVATVEGEADPAQAPVVVVPATARPAPAAAPLGGYRTAAAVPERPRLADVTEVEGLGARLGDAALAQACAKAIAAAEATAAATAAASARAARTWTFKDAAFFGAVGVAVCAVYVFWAWGLYLSLRRVGVLLTLLWGGPLALVLVMPLLAWLPESLRTVRSWFTPRHLTARAPRWLALGEGGASFSVNVPPAKKSLFWQLVCVEGRRVGAEWRYDVREVATGSLERRAGRVAVAPVIPPTAAPSSASPHHTIQWQLRVNDGAPEATVHRFRFAVLPVTIDPYAR